MCDAQTMNMRCGKLFDLFATFGLHQYCFDANHLWTIEFCYFKLFSQSLSHINFGTRKTEVLNSLIINITAKTNDTTDILQTFR